MNRRSFLSACAGVVLTPLGIRPRPHSVIYLPPLFTEEMVVRACERAFSDVIAGKVDAAWLDPADIACMPDFSLIRSR